MRSFTIKPIVSPIGSPKVLASDQQRFLTMLLIAYSLPHSNGRDSRQMMLDSPENARQQLAESNRAELEIERQAWSSLTRSLIAIERISLSGLTHEQATPSSPTPDPSFAFSAARY
ncbi:MAG: hypothetical protein WKF73_14040 [Nocardioidaceae bacterium]